MKAGTILFAGTDLGLWGPVTFTLSKAPDPAPPARATHRRVEVAVRLSLDAAMTATAWARARQIDALVSSKSEGMLEIRDENGRVLSWMAIPGDSSLPEAISRGKGRAELRFHAMEPISQDGSPLLVSIDPLDGQGPRLLHGVTAWNLKVAPSRPDSLAAHRTEITTGITFSARTCYAPAGANMTTRIDALLAEQARIESLAGKEAILEFGSFSRTVQIESLIAKPSEGWEYLEVEGQARRNMLPGDTEAEVQFTTDSSEDPATGETKTTIAGSIRAADYETASDKVEAILMAWRTSNRRVLKIQKTDEWVDGTDEDMPQWLEMKFSIELSEGSEDVRYTLKIDTREADDGQRTVYSGTAYSTDLVTLLATIETAAGGKHPVELRSELSLEYATDDQGELKLSQATFTREYATAAGKIRGNIERATAKGQFGEWMSTLSGSITASNLAIAQSIARSLIPVGALLRTDDEKKGAGTYGTASNGSDRAERETSLQFTYAWGTDHTNTSISYKVTSQPDYSTMTEKTTVAGTCWAMNKATAAAQVTLLLTALGITTPSEVSLTNSFERTGDIGPGLTPAERWLSFDFSYTKIDSISGVIGHDVIEAEWEVERTGQVNNDPITEIPLAMPVRQTGFGYNIGKLVATGRCRARIQATALAWGQAKRAKVSAFGGVTGSEDPPVERMRQTYVPFSGTSIAVHEFSFTYSFRFPSGLTDIWPAGLTL